MKKIAVSILAFLYLSASTGATIHFHYCMGKLVNWNLCHNQSDRCDKCGMKINHQSKNKGCCKDEFKQIKNEQDQNLSQTAIALIHPDGFPLSSFQSGLLSPSLTAIIDTNPVSNAPPRSRVALFIRNCIFLI